MKIDRIIECIAMKLSAEGITAENYDVMDALIALDDCVSATKLRTYLVNFESEIIKKLDKNENKTDNI